ncbi:MFS transporter [Nocardia blacklockiae]|uniref:MFS transporter n=1 Tax=Nocardia blacklockiae TaxID=480036 RepID=UPI0018937CBE|nr:MFS transporter [Nocardia blacklockiae]MBF6172118.1 GntR family transcriptional regulator [Nocardia blacklockiae]
MTTLAPGLPDWATRWILGHCPVGNPSDMREVADALVRSGKRVTEVTARLEHLAERATTAAISGETGSAIREALRQQTEHGRAQAEAFDALARFQYDAANTLELEQYTLRAIGIALVATVAASIGTQSVTARINADIAAGQARRRSLTWLIQRGTAFREAFPHLAPALSGFVLGSVSMGGATAAAEYAQILNGPGEPGGVTEMDWGKVGIAAAAGGVGGATAGLLARSLAPGLQQLAASLDLPMPTLLAVIGTTGLSGAGAGLTGGLTAYGLSGGEITGRSLAEMMLIGAAGGVAAGLVPAVVAARAASAAHVPATGDAAPRNSAEALARSSEFDSASGVPEFPAGDGVSGSHAERSSTGPAAHPESAGDGHTARPELSPEMLRTGREIAAEFSRNVRPDDFAPEARAGAMEFAAQNATDTPAGLGRFRPLELSQWQRMADAEAHQMLAGLGGTDAPPGGTSAPPASPSADGTGTPSTAGSGAPSAGDSGSPSTGGSGTPSAGGSGSPSSGAGSSSGRDAVWTKIFDHMKAGAVGSDSSAPATGMPNRTIIGQPPSASTGAGDAGTAQMVLAGNVIHVGAAGADAGPPPGQLPLGPMMNADGPAPSTGSPQTHVATATTLGGGTGTGLAEQAPVAQGGSSPPTGTGPSGPGRGSGLTDQPPGDANSPFDLSFLDGPAPENPGAKTTPGRDAPTTSTQNPGTAPGRDASPTPGQNTGNPTGPDTPTATGQNPGTTPARNTVTAPDAAASTPQPGTGTTPAQGVSAPVNGTPPLTGAPAAGEPKAATPPSYTTGTQPPTTSAQAGATPPPVTPPASSTLPHPSPAATAPASGPSPATPPGPTPPSSPFPAPAGTNTTPGNTLYPAAAAAGAGAVALPTTDPTSQDQQPDTEPTAAAQTPALGNTPASPGRTDSAPVGAEANSSGPQADAQATPPPGGTPLTTPPGPPPVGAWPFAQAPAAPSPEPAATATPPDQAATSPAASPNTAATSTAPAAASHQSGPDPVGRSPAAPAPVPTAAHVPVTPGTTAAVAAALGMAVASQAPGPTAAAMGSTPPGDQERSDDGLHKTPDMYPGPVPADATPHVPITHPDPHRAPEFGSNKDRPDEWKQPSGTEYVIPGGPETTAEPPEDAIPIIAHPEQPAVPAKSNALPNTYRPPIGADPLDSRDEDREGARRQPIPDVSPLPRDNASPDTGLFGPEELPQESPARSRYATAPDPSAPGAPQNPSHPPQLNPHSLEYLFDQSGVPAVGGVPRTEPAPPLRKRRGPALPRPTMQAPTGGGDPKRRRRKDQPEPTPPQPPDRPITAPDDPESGRAAAQPAARPSTARLRDTFVVRRAGEDTGTVGDEGPRVQAVGRAREWVRTLPETLPWLTEDQIGTAELLISELVANSLRHTTGRVEIIITTTDSDATRETRFAVTDDSEVVPQHTGMPDVDAERGRGGAFVDMLADANGTDPLPTGKSTWFELHQPFGDTPGGAVTATPDDGNPGSDSAAPATEPARPVSAPRPPEPPRPAADRPDTARESDRTEPEIPPEMQDRYGRSTFHYVRQVLGAASNDAARARLVQLAQQINHTVFAVATRQGWEAPEGTAIETWLRRLADDVVKHTFFREIRSGVLDTLRTGAVRGSGEDDRLLSAMSREVFEAGWEEDLSQTERLWLQRRFWLGLDPTAAAMSRTTGTSWSAGLIDMDAVAIERLLDSVRRRTGVPPAAEVAAETRSASGQGEPEAPTETPAPTTEPDRHGLTAHDLELVRMVAAGLSNDDIAGRLDRSASRVKFYLKQIGDTLGKNGRSGIVSAARELGLLDEAEIAPSLRTRPNLVLTEQEKTVLDLVSQGRSNKDVAAELGLSPLTVKAHLARIGGKLGITDRAGMVARALHSRLLPTTDEGSAFELSDPEREILGLVAEGMSNKEIAVSTGLSFEQVKGHLNRIGGKAGTRDRAGMVGRALRSEALLLTTPASDNEPVGVALSAAEIAVLGLVEKGWTNKQIGSARGISPATVSAYLIRIGLKLRASGRAASVQAAVDRGIDLEPEPAPKQPGGGTATPPGPATGFVPDIDPAEVLDAGRPRRRRPATYIPAGLPMEALAFNVNPQDGRPWDGGQQPELPRVTAPSPLGNTKAANVSDPSNDGASTPWSEPAGPPPASTQPAPATTTPWSDVDVTPTDQAAAPEQVAAQHVRDRAAAPATTPPTPAPASIVVHTPPEIEQLSGDNVTSVGGLITAVEVSSETDTLVLHAVESRGPSHNELRSRLGISWATTFEIDDLTVTCNIRYRNHDDGRVDTWIVFQNPSIDHPRWDTLRHSIDIALAAHFPGRTVRVDEWHYYGDNWENPHRIDRASRKLTPDTEPGVPAAPLPEAQGQTRINYRLGAEKPGPHDAGLFTGGETAGGRPVTSRTEYDGMKSPHRFGPYAGHKNVDVVVLGQAQDGTFLGPEKTGFTTNGLRPFLMLRSGTFITCAEGEHTDLLSSYLAEHASENERQQSSIPDAPTIVAGFGLWQMTEGAPELVSLFSGAFYAESKVSSKARVQLLHRLGERIDLSTIKFEFVSDSVGPAWWAPAENEGDAAAAHLVPEPGELVQIAKFRDELRKHLRGGTDHFSFAVTHVQAPYSGGLTFGVVYEPVLGEPATATVHVSPASTTAEARYDSFDPGTEPERTYPAFRTAHEVLTRWLTASGFHWADGTEALLSPAPPENSSAAIVPTPGPTPAGTPWKQAAPVAMADPASSVTAGPATGEPAAANSGTPWGRSADKDAQPNRRGRTDSTTGREQEPGTPQTLTDPETAVLELVYRGHVTADIAQTLGMSTSSVRSHQARAAKKFGTSGVVTTVLAAKRGGLIDCGAAAPIGDVRLTEEQRELLSRMAAGETDEKIGESWGVSPAAVQRRRNRIGAVLDATGSVPIFMKALRLGIIDDDGATSEAYDEVLAVDMEAALAQELPEAGRVLGFLDRAEAFREASTAPLPEFASTAAARLWELLEEATFQLTRTGDPAAGLAPLHTICQVLTEVRTRLPDEQAAQHALDAVRALHDQLSALHEAPRSLRHRSARVWAAASESLGDDSAVATSVERAMRRLHDIAAAADTRPLISHREKEVLALIGEGCGDEEIAVRLGITPGTVGQHVKNLRRKLGRGKRSELPTMAARAEDAGTADHMLASVWRWASAAPLSEREREILRMHGEGMSTAEIATALGCATGTVRNHVRHLLYKTGLNTRADLTEALASSPTSDPLQAEFRTQVYVRAASTVEQRTRRGVLKLNAMQKRRLTEEITDETFLVAAQRIPTDAPDPGGALAVIFREVAHDHLQSAQHRHSIWSALPASMRTGRYARSFVLADRQQLRERLEALRNAHPALHRCLALRHVTQLSEQRTAELMKYGVSVIRAMEYRAAQIVAGIPPESMLVYDEGPAALAPAATSAPAPAPHPAAAPTPTANLPKPEKGTTRRVEPGDPPGFLGLPNPDDLFGNPLPPLDRRLRDQQRNLGIFNVDGGGFAHGGRKPETGAPPAGSGAAAEPTEQQAPAARKGATEGVRNARVKQAVLVECTAGLDVTKALEVGRALAARTDADWQDAVDALPDDERAALQRAGGGRKGPPDPPDDTPPPRELRRRAIAKVVAALTAEPTHNAETTAREPVPSLPSSTELRPLGGTTGRSMTYAEATDVVAAALRRLPDDVPTDLVTVEVGDFVVFIADTGDTDPGPRATLEARVLEALTQLNVAGVPRLFYAGNTFRMPGGGRAMVRIQSRTPTAVRTGNPVPALTEPALRAVYKRLGVLPAEHDDTRTHLRRLITIETVIADALFDDLGGLFTTLEIPENPFAPVLQQLPFLDQDRFQVLHFDPRFGHLLIAAVDGRIVVFDTEFAKREAQHHDRPGLFDEPEPPGGYIYGGPTLTLLLQIQRILHGLARLDSAANTGSLTPEQLAFTRTALLRAFATARPAWGQQSTLPPVPVTAAIGVWHALGTDIDVELLRALDDRALLRNLSAGFPIKTTLAEAFRQAIRSGRLPAHRQLPSAAQLAHHFEISPANAGFVYAELRNEGLVEAQQGRGTVVAETTEQAESTTRPADPGFAVQGVVAADELCRQLTGRTTVTAIAEGLRTAIMEGGLSPGWKLPPHKEIADGLGVSGSTVARAYRKLRDEGHLAVHHGAGTVVADPEVAARAKRAAFMAAYQARNRLWHSPPSDDPTRGHVDRYGPDGEPALPEEMHYGAVRLVLPEATAPVEGVQNEWGNCYVIAGVNASGAVARDAIVGMVSQVGETVVVRAAFGTYTLNATLPFYADGRPAYATSPDGSTLVAYIEKAAAAHFGSYRAVEAGNAADFMYWALGDRYPETNIVDVRTMPVEDIRAVLTARVPVAVNIVPPERPDDVPADLDDHNLLKKHVYVPAHLAADGGVVLLNPWGRKHSVGMTVDILHGINASLHWVSTERYQPPTEAAERTSDTRALTPVLPHPTPWHPDGEPAANTTASPDSTASDEDPRQLLGVPDGVDPMPSAADRNTDVEYALASLARHHDHFPVEFTTDPGLVYIPEPGRPPAEVLADGVAPKSAGPLTTYRNVEQARRWSTTGRVYVARPDAGFLRADPDGSVQLIGGVAGRYILGYYDFGPEVPATLPYGFTTPAARTGVWTPNTEYGPLAWAKSPVSQADSNDSTDDALAAWLRELSDQGIDPDQLMADLALVWEFLRVDPKWALDARHHYDAVIMFGSPDDGGSAVVANLTNEHGLSDVPVVFSGYDKNAAAAGEPQRPWNTEAARFRLGAERTGVGAFEVIEEYEAANTRQNAINSVAELKDRGHPVGSIVAVCTPHHARRVWATITKKVPEVHTVAVVSAQVSLDNYLRHGLRSAGQPDPSPQHIVTEILKEIRRLMETPRLGLIVHQAIPQNVVAAYRETSRKLGVPLAKNLDEFIKAPTNPAHDGPAPEAAAEPAPAARSAHPARTAGLPGFLGVPDLDDPFEDRGDPFYQGHKRARGKERVERFAKPHATGGGEAPGGQPGPKGEQGVPAEPDTGNPPAATPDNAVPATTEPASEEPATTAAAPDNATAAKDSLIHVIRTEPGVGMRLGSEFLNTTGFEIMHTMTELYFMKEAGAGVAGAVGLATQVPYFAGALIAGHMTDHIRPKYLMLGSQVAMATGGLAATVGLASGGAYAVPLLIGTTLMGAASSVVYSSAAGKVIIEMVGEAQVGLARFNNLKMNATRVLGKGVGPAALQTGPWMAPLIDTATSLVNLASLWKLPATVAAPNPNKTEQIGLRESITEGVRALQGLPLRRRQNTNLGLTNFYLGLQSLQFTAMLTESGLTEWEQGAALALIPLGGLVGNVVRGNWITKAPIETLLTARLAGLAVPAIIQAATDNLWLASAAFAGTWAVLGTAGIPVAAYMARTIPSEVRGRVASLTTVTTRGAFALGPAIAGGSIALFGSDATGVSVAATFGTIAAWSVYKRLFKARKLLDCINQTAAVIRELGLAEGTALWKWQKRPKHLEKAIATQLVEMEIGPGKPDPVTRTIADVRNLKDGADTAVLLLDDGTRMHALTITNTDNARGGNVVVFDTNITRPGDPHTDPDDPERIPRVRTVEEWKQNYPDIEEAFVAFLTTDDEDDLTSLHPRDPALKAPRKDGTVLGPLGDEHPAAPAPATQPGDGTIRLPAPGEAEVVRLFADGMPRETLGAVLAMPPHRVDEFLEQLADKVGGSGEPGAAAAAPVELSADRAELLRTIAGTLSDAADHRPCAVDATIADRFRSRMAAESPAGKTRVADGPATGRERAVLRLAAEGLSARAIGRALGVSDGTVRADLDALAAKLGAADRNALIHAAHEVWAADHPEPEPQPNEDVRLQPRELQTLGLLAANRSTTDIADELGLTQRAVRVVRSRLRAKIGIKDVDAMVEWARGRGILPELPAPAAVPDVRPPFDRALLARTAAELCAPAALEDVNATLPAGSGRATEPLPGSALPNARTTLAEQLAVAPGIVTPGALRLALTLLAEQTQGVNPGTVAAFDGPAALRWLGNQLRFQAGQEAATRAAALTELVWPDDAEQPATDGDVLGQSAFDARRRELEHGLREVIGVVELHPPHPMTTGEIIAELHHVATVAGAPELAQLADAAESFLCAPGPQPPPADPVQIFTMRRQLAEHLDVGVDETTRAHARTLAADETVAPRIRMLAERFAELSPVDAAAVPTAADVAHAAGVGKPYVSAVFNARFDERKPRFGETVQRVLVAARRLGVLPDRADLRGLLDPGFDRERFRPPRWVGGEFVPARFRPQPDRTALADASGLAKGVVREAVKGTATPDELRRVRAAADTIGFWYHPDSPLGTAGPEAAPRPLAPGPTGFVDPEAPFDGPDHPWKPARAQIGELGTVHVDGGGHGKWWRKPKGQPGSRVDAPAEPAAAPEPAAAAESGPAEKPVPVRELLTTNKAYRQLYISNAISGLGDSVQQSSLPLLTLSLTGSPMAAGLTQFALWVPSVLFELPAGYAADFLDRGRTMRNAQWIALSTAAGAGAAITFGAPHIGLVLAGTTLVEGTAAKFYARSLRGTVRDLVTVEQLPSANRMTAVERYLAGTAGRVLGPALLGLNQVLPFAVNTASFALNQVSLAKLRKDLPEHVAGERRSFRYALSDIRDGAAQIWRDPFLRLYTAVTPLTNASIGVLNLRTAAIVDEATMPGIAAGVVLGAGAIGGVIGGFLPHNLIGKAPVKILYPAALLGFTGVAALQALTTNPFVAAVGALGTSVIGVGMNVRVENHLQENVPQEFYNRAASARDLVLSSGTAAGGLLGGAMLQAHGVDAAGWAPVAVIGAAAAGVTMRRLGTYVHRVFGFPWRTKETDDATATEPPPRTPLRPVTPVRHFAIPSGEAQRLFEQVRGLEPDFAGTGNRLNIVDTSSGPAVVRFGKEQRPEAFLKKWMPEHAAIEYVRESDVRTPELLYAGTHPATCTEFTVVRYVRSETRPFDDPQLPHWLPDLLNQVRTLSSLPLPAGMDMDVPQWQSQMIQYADEAYDNLPDVQRARLDELGIGPLSRYVQPDSSRSGDPVVFSHNDLWPMNLGLDAKKKLWIFDWELAGPGDPVFNTSFFLDRIGNPNAKTVAEVTARFGEWVLSVNPGVDIEAGLRMYNRMEYWRGAAMTAGALPEYVAADPDIFEPWVGFYHRAFSRNPDWPDFSRDELRTILRRWLD